MANIELNSTTGGDSTAGQVGSGSGSEEVTREDTIEQALGGHSQNDGVGSTHGSLRSIAGRMEAVFRLFLRATTWVEIGISTVLFTLYIGYWLLFRTGACLWLATDIPSPRCFPFNQSSCQYPAPLGSNSNFRPQFALLKILTLAALVYMIFVMINIFQLELIGRWALTGQCILALTNCRRIFLIFDQTYNISEPQFRLINHILRQHFMEIENGSLVVIPQPPQIMNMSDPSAFKPLAQTQGQAVLTTSAGSVLVTLKLHGAACNGTGRHEGLPASVLRVSGERVVRTGTAALRDSTGERVQSAGKKMNITVPIKQAKK